MDYNININKICRVCLEENVLTSIFNTEFAMIPAEMLMLCAKVKVTFSFEISCGKIDLQSVLIDF